ncbi:MAG: histidine kinase [Tannerellaceae bacterium]|nr:histidine kinase [Tannerellaceae bacterium]
MTEIENETNLLYRLLIDKSYRWFRHLILIVAVILITINQLLYHIFHVTKEESYIYVYIPVFSTFIFYLATVYLNIYWLIPRYFLTRRFGWYTFWFTILAVTVSQLLILEEYLVLKLPGVHALPNSYFYKDNFLIFSCLSDTFVLAISLFGASMTVILKSWLLENKKLNKLKNRKVQIEVEQVKEKVSPSFLFSVLHRMGHLAPTEPQQASAMLVYLSRLLRYQLYEGTQEKVLLTAEIQFLSNYLLLEQYNTPGFEFRIHTAGKVAFLFVSPLLFLPFIQQGITDWKESNTLSPLEFFFIEENDQLLFRYLYPEGRKAENNIPGSLFRRLQILYPESFNIKENIQSVNNSFNLILQV